LRSSRPRGQKAVDTLTRPPHSADAHRMRGEKRRGRDDCHEREARGRGPATICQLTHSIPERVYRSAPPEAPRGRKRCLFPGIGAIRRTVRTGGVPREIGRQISCSATHGAGDRMLRAWHGQRPEPAAEEQRDEVSRVFRAPMFGYSSGAGSRRRRAELFACAGMDAIGANSLYRIIPPGRASGAEELVIPPGEQRPRAIVWTSRSTLISGVRRLTNWNTSSEAPARVASAASRPLCDAAARHPRASPLHVVEVDAFFFDKRTVSDCV